MKVLYLVPSLKATGPTRQLFNIVTNQPSCVESMVVTLSGEVDGTLLHDFIAKGINVEQLALGRIKGLFLAASMLNKLVDNFCPDIIHSQGLRGDYYSCKVVMDVPKIATLRNFPQYDYPAAFGAVFGRLLFGRHMKALSGLSIVVGVSDAVAANAHALGLERVTTIRNSVNIDLYQRLPVKIRQGLREKLGFEPEDRVFVTSGLSVGKNSMLVINAFIAVFGTDSRFKLIVLGDGEQASECKKVAQGITNIIFTGLVNNVVEYLNVANAFVSASRFEGMPNAVIEALACGLPVLLSDITPHTEILNLNNKVGQLFQTDNLAALSDGMRCLISADYNNFESTSFAHNDFSSSAMALNYYELYARYINEHK